MFVCSKMLLVEKKGELTVLHEFLQVQVALLLRMEFQVYAAYMRFVYRCICCCFNVHELAYGISSGDGRGVFAGREPWEATMVLILQVARNRLLISLMKVHVLQAQVLLCLKLELCPLCRY